MRVVCPRCHAHFLIATHLLNPVGRKLKCMKCGTVWPTVPAGHQKNPCNDHDEEYAHHSSPASASLHTPEAEETREDREDVHAHANRKNVREDRCPFGEETAKYKKAAEQVFSIENLTPEEQRFGHKPASVTVSHSEGNDLDVRKHMNSYYQNGITSVAAPDTTGKDAETPMVGSSASPFTPSDSPNKKVPNDNPDPLPSVLSNGFEKFSQKREKKISYNLFMSILVGVGALTASAGGAWYGQVQMFEGWWPALRGHLTGLGFPVIDLIGSLEFSDITALMTVEDNVQILIVNGTVQNVAPVAIHLPSMRLLFRDENRRVVRKGDATDLSIPILLPGERTQFFLKLHDPPVGTTIDIGLDRK